MNNTPVVNNTSASDACRDIEPILYNQTVGRSALVPHYNYYSGYFGFDDYYDDDRKGSIMKVTGYINPHGKKPN